MSARFPYRLVTGNPGKLAEARRIVGPTLESLSLDLPEIQSLDLVEVLAAKAEAAFDAAGEPVVVEETGLELDALNGFPGPFVRWMLEAVGPDGIARTVAALGDPRATARCALRAFDGRQAIDGVGETRGRLVLPGRGANGFGWDPVFLPDGRDRTYGELADADKDQIGHRGRAWRSLLAALGRRA